MFPSGNPACSHHSSPGTPQESLNTIRGNPNQIPDNPAKNSPNVALCLCGVDVGVKWVFGHTLWDSTTHHTFLAVQAETLEIEMGEQNAAFFLTAL